VPEVRDGEQETCKPVGRGRQDEQIHERPKIRLLLLRDQLCLLEGFQDRRSQDDDAKVKGRLRTGQTILCFPCAYQDENRGHEVQQRNYEEDCPDLDYGLVVLLSYSP
jgi:hypothetical protein